MSGYACKVLGYVCCTVILCACATDPNSIWFEGAMMNFHVLITGQNEYKLTADGAGAHKKNEVERGFLLRAEQICGSKPLEIEFKTVPYQYGSSGGGFSFVHNAFKTTGRLKCK